jgi:hypothetical protein
MVEQATRSWRERTVAQLIEKRAGCTDDDKVKSMDATRSPQRHDSEILAPPLLR